MDKQHLKTPADLRYGKRHVQVAILSLTGFVIYALRINLSVAIVSITGADKAGETFDPDAPKDPVYEWDETTQGLVLGSFFWGYILTQVPAGILTQRYGGHRILSMALVSTSILTAVLPPCAFLGDWKLVCANRMLQGVTQGFVYPSIYTLMGLWVPPYERVTLSAIILSAQNLGPVGATPLAGYLAATWGWPSIFYCFGAIGLCAAAVVFFLGADSPASHSSISEKERKYIEGSLGGAKEKRRIPWKDILTSHPVWASYVALTCSGGVFLIFLTEIPKYLNSILHFDLKENGLISALPYAACWALSYVCSFTCNFIISHRWLTVTQTRKVYNSIGHVGPAITMVALGYTTDKTISVVLLTLSVSLIAFTYQGVQSTFMDLAPNFSGTIFSVANLLTALASIGGPIAVSLIVTDANSADQWRIVYFLLAGAMIIGNIVFVFWGSAEVQPWNYSKRRLSTISLSQRGTEVWRVRVSVVSANGRPQLRKLSA